MCLMSPELALQLTALDPAVLGGRIKAARVAAGLTQPELAGADASVAYLSRIESGQRRPNVDLLQTLAGKLGVTIEFLAHGDGWADASRLELQLDHAELSLAGGEGDTALALAREALGSPGLQAVPGGVERARYVEAAALDRLGDPCRDTCACRPCSTTRPTRSSGSRSPHRSAASGARRDSSSAPSRSRRPSCPRSPTRPWAPRRASVSR